MPRLHVRFLLIKDTHHQVQLQTEIFFVSDVLRGDDQTELRVRLIRILDEEVPVADD